MKDYSSRLINQDGPGQWNSVAFIKTKLNPVRIAPTRRIEKQAGSKFALSPLISLKIPLFGGRTFPSPSLPTRKNVGWEITSVILPVTDYWPLIPPWTITLYGLELPSAPRNMEDLSGINRLCPFSDPIDATQLLQWLFPTLVYGLSFEILRDTYERLYFS